MSTPQDGGAAFPRRFTGSDMDGMSLRDYFAAQAMAALVGITALAPAEEIEAIGDGQIRSRLASGAYLLADAMLKAKDNP